MKGTILNIDWDLREGILSGEDGNRYRFGDADWRDQSTPAAGQTVDFVPAGDRAHDIYRVMSPASAYPKSKIAAALLAFFLGMFGAHKFYLGYTQQGVILLAGTILGIALAIVVIGVFMLIATWVVAVVEFVMYIAKSDEEFNDTYVVNKRPWF